MPPKRELTDNTVIDISHESLIRQWKTLSNWVNEEAESSKIFLRLAESAQLHGNNKKDYLFGLELDQYSEWREQYKPDMADWTYGAHRVIYDKSMNHSQANCVLRGECSLS